MRIKEIISILNKGIQDITNIDYVEIGTIHGQGDSGKILVKAGQKVKKGDILVDCTEDKLCACVHSSISGEVVSIKKAVGQNKGAVDVICIKKSKDVKGVAKKYDKIKDYTIENIRERLKHAGIVGMGGAGFPSYAKIKKDVCYTHLILNACVSDYLSCADLAVLIQEYKKVKQGIELLKNILKLKKVVIIVNKFAKKIITNLIDKNDECIEVKYMPNKYGQGDEKIFCKKYFNIDKENVFPAHSGYLIYNVQTICAIYDALKLGKPCTTRVVTIYGKCVRNAGNYRVPIGSVVEDIVKQTGGEVCLYEEYKSRENEAMKKYEEIQKLKEEYRQNTSPEFVENFIKTRKENNKYIFDFLKYEHMYKGFIRYKVLYGGTHWCLKFDTDKLPIYKNTYAIGIVNKYQYDKISKKCNFKN